MAYTTNTFCWHGVITPDTGAAKQFYVDTLGWDVQTMPMGDREATMFAPVDGRPRLHLGEPQEAGIPAHWENYLRVDDVDASVKTAVEKGGALLVPPMDIPPGRIAVLAAPSGAVISLFREANEDIEDASPCEGDIHWTELHSHELDADLAWLEASFGISSSEMAMPDGPYFILSSGETQVGGAMTARQPGAPSMWMSWVRVADVDDVAARVAAKGGKLLSQMMEVPGVGRMAVAADPTGGVFGILQPATA